MKRIIFLLAVATLAGVVAFTAPMKMPPRSTESQTSPRIALEHWCSSGFANTDLDLQLKKHGIHRLIIVGLIAHTCVEATVRYAAELGYEVTMVKDATADYSDEEMHAALDVNILNYASAIVITNEVVEALSFHVRVTHSTSKA